MKPVLLLIAGMLNDEDVWADVRAALSSQADVRIALPVQASLPEMAAAAWSLLDDVPPQVPIVLAGFSLGGYVAIEMLARPKRPLHAAALLSTSARPETPEAASTREKTMAAMRKDFGKVVQGIAAWNTSMPGPDLSARLNAMMLRVGADTAIGQMRATMARADHRNALGALALPVLVACGAEDRTTPPALSQELAALMPGARLEMVQASGHMLPMEQSATVARLLGELLATTEKSEKSEKSER